MITIHKYIIPNALGTFEIELEMPKGAKLLSTGQQSEVPCLWYVIDTEAEKHRRHFVFYGTGMEIPSHSGFILQHIATFHFHRKEEGRLVLHLFEKTEEQPSPKVMLC